MDVKGVRIRRRTKTLMAQGKCVICEQKDDMTGL